LDYLAVNKRGGKPCQIYVFQWFRKNVLRS